MKRLVEVHTKAAERKERILQFGEGNFLRGFVDWMLDKMNKDGVWDGSVVLVQPIDRGLTDMINDAKGLYTMILRGKVDGQTVEDVSVNEVVSRCIDPYRNFDHYLETARNPDMRFVISNTTEAGITYHDGDKATDCPPASFPAKLTILLHTRWQHFKGAADKGLVMIPCELIDRNGDKLKDVVFRWAKEWDYEAEFISWLENSCDFLNSLVDRIVTGYPRAEAEALWEKLGYRDDILNTAEPFHLWVIEGDKKYAEELPFTKAGLHVIWTDDMTPYRTRKVRILNGAHTASVLGAYLAGFDIVRDMVEDPIGSNYLRKVLNEEILPILPLPADEVKEFANATLERFANPFIDHRLLDISLNSVSKFKARVLPSLQEAAAKNGSVTPILSFSLAALVAFYKGTQIEHGALVGNRNGESYSIKDDLPVLQEFARLWTAYPDSPAKVMEEVLANTGWWDSDLRDIPGMKDACIRHIENIFTNGAKTAMAEMAGVTAESGVQA